MVNILITTLKSYDLVINLGCGIGDLSARGIGKRLIGITMWHRAGVLGDLTLSYGVSDHTVDKVPAFRFILKKLSRRWLDRRWQD